jgi:hypothetical protein
MEVVDIVDQCSENDVSVNLWSTYRLYHYMFVLMKHLSLESFFISVFFIFVTPSNSNKFLIFDRFELFMDCLFFFLRTHTPYVISLPCAGLPASRACFLCRESAHDKDSAHGTDKFSSYEKNIKSYEWIEISTISTPK